MARLVYLGSPQVAVPPLEALTAAGHEVALVVSRPDARRGRGGATTPSPVKAAAQGKGIAVSDELDDVAGVGAELAVVVAYGRLVPRRLLDALDFVNIHFSLLPRWRGAAPVERAVLAGDEETGVCVMRLEEGLDTGPVLGSRRIAVGDAHAGELAATLAGVGADLLVELLRGGVAGLGPGEPQVGEPTYAAKLDPGELRLDWALPAAQLARIVRLDRAWTTFRGERLRVLRARPTAASSGDLASTGPPGTLQGTVASTADGLLELLVVQPQGRRPMPAAEWLRGVRAGPGELLGEPEAGR